MGLKGQKPLYILPANKTFQIPTAAWHRIAVYKLFFPPDTPVKIGKRTVPIDQLFPWKPGEDQCIFDIPDRIVRLMVDKPRKCASFILKNSLKLI